MDIIKRLLELIKPKAPQPLAEETGESGEGAEAGATTLETVEVEEEAETQEPETEAVPQVETAEAPEGLPVGSTRPLQEDEAFDALLTPWRSSRLVYGGKTDVGKVRATNQDAMVAIGAMLDSSSGHADFGFFMVADGMGGHLDGEKASALAVSIVAERVLRDIYIPLLHHEARDADRLTVGEVLDQAVQEANKAIVEQVPGSGTTASVVVLIGSMAHVAHVGDIRVYLVTSSGMDQLTRDHSLVQRLVEVGHITKEEAVVHERRNELYRVLGAMPEVEVDVITRRLPPGARLLICSDGLWGEVPESTIMDVLVSARTPQEACDRLVSLALELGGRDNITVVVAQMPN